MIQIVVGLGENENVKFAMNKANKINGLNIKLVESPDELLSALKDKEIDAVIRGSLKSSKIMKGIKLSYENNINKVNRATYIKEKIGNDNFEFLLSPVGIDEGRTIQEKVGIAIQSVDFVKSLGKTPKIAVLASGREDDYGRSDYIDKSLDDSKIIVDKIKEILDVDSNERHDYKYNIKNYYILIEEAIKDKNNIIIPPDGIIGNILFRTLVLLNSWSSYGAVTLGLEKIFIDTSRDQSIDGYYRAIEFAFNLAKIKKTETKVS